MRKIIIACVLSLFCAISLGTIIGPIPEYGTNGTVCNKPGCSNQNITKDYEVLKEEYSVLRNEFELLKEKEKYYSNLEEEYSILETLYKRLEAQYISCSQQEPKSLLSYQKNNKIYYVSSNYGIEFFLDRDLQDGFSVLEDDDGCFGLYYTLNGIIEPVLIYRVLPTVYMNEQKELNKDNDEFIKYEIVQSYDNGLSVYKSYAHFNASQIAALENGSEIYNNIINPYIKNVKIVFE